ncbi:MFS transporter [Virgisporangium ochraceum]|uniref:MFS transporter n=1 Tax=Virgisporangium ochraceum TaxID=65505 RepID=A0A8J3ZNP5_9ACTN|nr:MFS transporter [Virgisporangium ochraceum]GIJ67579.1 MFS transporter [Virgisporangium ochraceum]
MAFAGLATGTVLRLPGGVLADRWPLRPLLIGSETVRAVVTGSLVVAVLVGRLTFAHLLVAAMVSAACAVCADPAQTVAVRQVVPAGQLPHALAQNEARGHVAGLGGQPLGGWLYGLGAVVPLAAHAVSSAVSAWTVVFVRRLPAGGRGVRHPVWSDLRGGLRFVWRSRFLRSTLAVAAAFQFVFAGLGLLIVAGAAADGTPAVHVGTALALAGVGGLLGAWATPFVQRRIPFAALVSGFGWTGAGCLALMAVLPHVYAAGALLAVVYAVATPANAMLVAAQMAATPEHLQGRVVSAAMLVAGCVAPLGPLAAGALFDRVGRPATVAAFAVLTALVAVATHLRPPTVDP